jgi:hypothetical protein
MGYWTVKRVGTSEVKGQGAIVFVISFFGVTVDK